MLNVDFAGLRAKLVSFGMAFCHSEEIVADCVQETMLAILKLEKEPENLESFAVIVLRNKIMKFYNWRNSRRETGFPENENGSIVEPIAPEATNETAEMAERLKSMMFPPKWQKIVEMATSGMTAAEIAAEEEMSLSAYYNTISRIRAHARKQLAE